VAAVVVLLRPMVLLVVRVAVTAQTRLSHKLCQVVQVQPCRVLTVVLLQVLVTRRVAVVVALVLSVLTRPRALLATAALVYRQALPVVLLVAVVVLAVVLV
jgi:hypothetical protein